MKKQMILFTITICILLAVSILTLYKPTEKPNEMFSSNGTTTTEPTWSSGCNSSSGISSTFDISDSTTIRFYIENNADFDITMKLQKARGSKWNDSNMNEESTVTVKANSHKLIESDGTTYSKNTYRFSATGSRGGNYDYLVTMRELDN